MNDQPSTPYNLPPEQQNRPSPDYPPAYGSAPWQQPGMPPPIQPGYFPPNLPYAYDRPMTVPLRTSRLAPAGLTLGILSLVMILGIFFGGVVGTVSLLLGFITSTAGIILSALNLRSVSRKGMAISGLVLASIAFVLLLLLITIGLLVNSGH